MIKSTQKIIARKIRESLNKFGYDFHKIQNKSISDLTDDLSDFKKILYYAKSNTYPFFCYVPIEHIRGHVASYRFDKKDAHPFVYAVDNAQKHDNEKEAIKECLKDFYNEVKPDSPTEVLGLKESEAPKLADKEAWMAVHPWQDKTIKEIKFWRPKVTLSENLAEGVELSIEHGWHLFGPVSKEKLNVECKRLYNVMKSIENNSYIITNNSSHISSCLLVDDNNNYRWVIYDGQHRTAVLSSLGHKMIPVIVEKIVERKDVKLWPNVKSGDFTAEAALKVFDKVFKGETNILP